MTGFDPRALAREVVEECWRDAAGVERMRGLVTPDYVHHTAFGRGAYHFRHEGGRIAEDWDVFFPAG